MRVIFGLLVFGCMVLGAQVWASDHTRPDWCSADRLTKTEKVICDTPVLSALDIEMVDAYRAARRQSAPAVAHQREWLRWRNSCKTDVDCLIGRYQGRLVDLGGVLEIIPIGEDVVVERRVANGRFETVFGDGRVEWFGLSEMGVTLPDGTEMITASFEMVQGDSLPALPDQYGDWAQGLEQSLEGVLKTHIGQTAFVEYKRDFAVGDFFDRVSSHISAIDFLMQNE